MLLKEQESKADAQKAKAAAQQAKADQVCPLV
jgi:hypothetical protein